jgi:hypothetical protein
VRAGEALLRSAAPTSTGSISATTGVSFTAPLAAAHAQIATSASWPKT